MSALIRELNEVPLAGLMLVVAVGYTLGRLRWRGFSLGPAGGTLLAALGAGSLGLSFSGMYGEQPGALTVGTFGFALFIYSVGFEAGPRFFSSLLGGPGWRFVAVGTVVNVLALCFAVLFGKLFGLTDALTAGVLSGALTSAPTYAAAAERTTDVGSLAVSFAVTYPIGLAVVVILIDILPRLMGDDLAAESDEDMAAGGAGDHRGSAPELVRAFTVGEPAVVGRTLEELALPRRTGCYVTRLHRGQEFVIPTRDTRLEEGDTILAKGRIDELKRFSELVGPEVFDADLQHRMPPPRRINVSSRKVIGKSLLELELIERHRCLVTGIERGGVMLEPAADIVIARNDVLEVVGRRDAIRAAAAELGRFEQSTAETDIAIYAGGIFLGLRLGDVHLDILGMDLSPGMAGGLLLAGVLLGRFRRIGPFSAHVPRSARQLVRDLGILLFIAETGVQAGEGPLVPAGGSVWPILLSALLVTVLSVLGGVLFGRRVLRLRAADTWGAVGGGMTSSAALVAVRRAADSNEPALAYAAAYTVASVFVTVAGQLVVLLMG